VLALGVAERELDRGRESLPLRELLFELRAAGARERVELRVASRFVLLATRRGSTLLLEAVERGIERALLDLEDFARDGLDALGDGPAVSRFGGDRLEMRTSSVP
jgi:hypothetical protein